MWRLQRMQRPSRFAADDRHQAEVVRALDVVGERRRRGAAAARLHEAGAGGVVVGLRPRRGLGVEAGHHDDRVAVVGRVDRRLDLAEATALAEGLVELDERALARPVAPGRVRQRRSADRSAQPAHGVGPADDQQALGGHARIGQPQRDGRGPARAPAQRGQGAPRCALLAGGEPRVQRHQPRALGLADAVAPQPAGERAEARGALGRVHERATGHEVAAGRRNHRAVGLRGDEDRVALDVGGDRQRHRERDRNRRHRAGQGPPCASPCSAHLNPNVHQRAGVSPAATAVANALLFAAYVVLGRRVSRQEGDRLVGDRRRPPPRARVRARRAGARGRSRRSTRRPRRARSGVPGRSRTTTPAVGAAGRTWRPGRGPPRRRASSCRAARPCARARPGRRRARRPASRRARVDLRPAVLGEHDEGGRGGRGAASRLDRRRVVAPGGRVRGGVQAGAAASARFTYVGPGARRGARATRARPRACRCRPARTATSGRRRRRSRSPASRRRPGTAPTPCAPSSRTGTSTPRADRARPCRSPSRRASRRRGGWRGRPRRRCPRSGDSAYGHAALGARGGQRAEQAGVLLVGGQDLVAAAAGRGRRARARCRRSSRSSARRRRARRRAAPRTRRAGARCSAPSRSK